jgi:hypothetical protein
MKLYDGLYLILACQRPRRYLPIAAAIFLWVCTVDFYAGLMRYAYLRLTLETTTVMADQLPPFIGA